MAKHKPEIVGSIRIAGKVYLPGMEEELEKDAKKGLFKTEQVNLTRLVEKGVIVGMDLPEPDEPAAEDAGGKKNLGEGEKTGSKDKDPK